MTDHSTNGQPEPSEVDDLGAPVVELLDHEVPVSPHFRARVHRSIERRILAAEATQFGVLAPITALLELLRVIFEGLGFVDQAQDPPTPPADTAREADPS